MDIVVWSYETTADVGTGGCNDSRTARPETVEQRARKTSLTGSGSIQVLRVKTFCVNDVQTIMSLFELFPVESRSDSDFQKSATDVAISFAASSMPELVAILDSSRS